MGLLSWLKPKKKKSYDALKADTTRDDWNPYPSQPTATPWEIYGLNLRVEDLLKNDANAERGLRVLESNIVGSGVKPQAISKTNNTGLVSLLEEKLIAFFDSTECDSSQTKNLYGVQSVALRELAKSGNVFIRKRNRSFSLGLTAPFQLQVISYDYLATDYTNAGANETIVNGIGYNKKWQPTNYYFYKENPRESYSHLVTGSTFTKEVIKVRAKDVCHLYRQDLADQRLGVSWFAPVIPTMRMIANYRLNVLTKQQMQSSITAFAITDDTGDTYNLAGKKSADGTQSTIKRGQINRLNPGESIEFPTLPDLSGDSEFYKQFKRDMASGLGISYEEMSGDYSEVNYSSARMGWIAMSRNIRAWQSNIFEAQFLSILTNWFLDDLVLQGSFSMAQRQDLGIRWVFPRREMLDPVKETKSALDQIHGKIKSRKRVIEEMGDDYLAVMNEIAFDEKTQKELGLISEPVVEANDFEDDLDE